MISLNLLPDVKKDLLRVRRERNLVVSISVIVVGASIGVLLLLSGTLGVLIGAKALMENSIKNDEQTIKQAQKKKQLDKYITIQNQLKQIGKLKSDQQVYSRLMDYLTQLNPAAPNNVQISSAKIEAPAGSSGDTSSSSSSSASADGITMTIEGKTTNFSALDVYKNTLSKAQLSYEVEEEDTSSDSESSANSDGTYSKETSSDSDSSDSDSQSKKKKKSATKKKAMKENLVTAVNVKDSSLSAGGSQNEALVSFTLTVTFNDSAFSPKSTNIKLEVPKETTSDGDRNAPKETFHTDAKDKSNDKKDEQ
ncbi:MAG: hypothetical protein ACFNL6_00735 [Candidatus Nanoperiomorbus sp.]|jgi:hypothetical protein cdiviTM7_02674|uniref:hypothetical protein n=1 Tax=Candidatus Nanoperiomorbus periodonticus TaxID=2171989 RepID=UPI00101CD57C|nr:hypothetical protein [Candidatus Nanoperiomorbus periodonticus]RYC76292.1 hypothetical protein G51EAM_00257 [Candidatus Nanoperiomorbus periodonticus]